MNNAFPSLSLQDNAEVSAQRLRQEQEGLRGALSRVEATMSQVAGAAQMETLGLVVEEQRRRIDSILTGDLAAVCCVPNALLLFLNF
jgi:hypothetical protein